jgi:hypothetical protein
MKTVQFLSVPATVFCVLLNSTAFSQVSGLAFGRFGSGNVIFAEDSKQLPNQANASTGIAQVSGDQQAAGVGNSQLSSGALSAATGVLGVTYTPNNNTNYFIVADGRAGFQDTIAVQSASLPNGSPVTIQFAFEVAYDHGTQHTLGLNGTPSNHATSLAFVSGGANSGQGSFTLSGDDHQFLRDTRNASATSLGLFAAPHFETTIEAVVGGTINFNIGIETTNSANVAPFAPGQFDPLENTMADAHVSAAIAFGANAVETVATGFGIAQAPDVTLFSNYLNASFPVASNANAVNAQANLPPNPIPEPRSLALLAVGILALLSRMRLQNNHKSLNASTK